VRGRMTGRSGSGRVPWSRVGSVTERHLLMALNLMALNRASRPVGGSEVGGMGIRRDPRRLPRVSTHNRLPHTHRYCHATIWARPLPSRGRSGRACLRTLRETGAVCPGSALRRTGERGTAGVRVGRCRSGSRSRR